MAGRTGAAPPKWSRASVSPPAPRLSSRRIQLVFSMKSAFLGEFQFPIRFLSHSLKRGEAVCIKDTMTYKELCDFACRSDKRFRFEPNDFFSEFLFSPRNS